MRQNRVHPAAGGRTAADRLVIVAGVALVWGLAVFGRLAYLQLIRHGDYLARALRQ